MCLYIYLFVHMDLITSFSQNRYLRLMFFVHLLIIQSYTGIKKIVPQSVLATLWIIL